MNAKEDRRRFDDLTRRSTDPYCFRDLASYMRTVRDAFVRDPWQSQEHYDRGGDHPAGAGASPGAQPGGRLAGAASVKAQGLSIK